MDGNDKKSKCNCLIKSHTFVAIVYNAMNVQRYPMILIFVYLFVLHNWHRVIQLCEIPINQKTTNPKAKHHPKNHNLYGKIPNCLLNGFTNKIGTLQTKYQVNLFRFPLPQRCQLPCHLSNPKALRRAFSTQQLLRQNISLKHFINMNKGDKIQIN